MKQQKCRVGLVGVTGYAGLELVRILLEHPGFELAAASSREQAGKSLGLVFPFLQGTTLADCSITSPDAQVFVDCQVVFLAVPHGAAMEMAQELVQAGIRVVDLSADFRLRAVEDYEDWYKTAHSQQTLLGEAVYGLPELYASEIAQARLVANPGCYPTAAILSLYPALQYGLIENTGLIIDAKSGASGAGRKAAVQSLFCEVADSFRPYNLTGHRHTPEIEQELSVAARTALRLSFNTHLLPMNRGILSTGYAFLRPGISEKQVRAAYTEFFQKKPWVRFLPQGIWPETRWVRGTNYCDLGLITDQRTGRLIVVSAIDNLCRGAAGQAVVNANLMLGFEEGLGLQRAPFLP